VHHHADHPRFDLKEAENVLISKTHGRFMLEKQPDYIGVNYTLLKVIHFN